MDIKNSIVAILNTENEIVGTGFVAAACLIFTCLYRPTLELTLQRKTDSGYPVVAALTRPGGFLPCTATWTICRP
jgi:hypothetical protein